MKPINLALGIALMGMIISFAACFQPVPRPGDPDASPTEPPTAPSTVTPSQTITPALTSTVQPTLGLPLVVTPTEPATPRPTPRPVDPTAVSPTPIVAPTVERLSVEPTPQPTTRPTSTIFLEVRSPVDDSQVRSGAVVLSGVVSPGATVSINQGQAIVEEYGKFRGAVDLVPGKNEIQVVAMDIQGNQVTKVVTVTSITVPVRPFMLVITEPKHESIVSDENIQLSGRTGPEAVVSVNGALQSVDLMGSFSTPVVLEPGPNLFDVVATNVDGRVSSSVVAVIYRP